MQTATLPVGTHQTMNRYEIKYLVATRQVPELLREFSPYTKPDPHSPEWGYPVHSIYWDTKGFMMFWEKIEGVKYRRKLRFRRYGDSPDIFIEIKQREDRTVQKRRLRLPMAESLAMFGEGGGSLNWDLVESDTVATEVALMIERLRLWPKMAVRYQRRAVFGAFDPQLRITFDGRIQYHPSDFSLADPFREGRYVLDPRSSVLEIKFDHRAPVWLTKAIRRHGLQMVRMSKYCSAIDKQYFGGENT